MSDVRQSTKSRSWIWGAFSALCLAVLSYIAWTFSPWGQLAYFEERTGIDLPAFPSELAEYDDGELSCILYVVLPPDQVSRLLATPDFRRGEQERLSGRIEPARMFRIGMLPEKYQHPSRGARLHQAQGCRGRTSWQAVLDENSGALWIEVQYPDWGGDGPSCARENGCGGGHPHNFVQSHRFADPGEMGAVRVPALPGRHSGGACGEAVVSTGDLPRLQARLALTWTTRSISIT